MTEEELEAVAVAALKNTDPDAEGVRIRAAYRDVSCSMNGSECYRRVIYPGQTESVWPDAERLPALGVRASERRATTHCEVPVGTIVLDWERPISKGRKGYSTFSAGVVVTSEDQPTHGHIVWCETKTLRSRSAYKILLPNGTSMEIPKH